MGSGLAGAIRSTPIIESPWPHIEVAGMLGDLSIELRYRWPTDGFTWLKHSDITHENGTSLRRYWRLRDVFPAIAEQINTQDVEDAFREKFGVTGELFPQALLIEDAPGYKIRRHTDCAGKVITCQVYLADDHKHLDNGVLLQTRDGDSAKRIPYLFDHGYAFKVTNHSWHRVHNATVTRRSLQLIYYSTPAPHI